MTRIAVLLLLAGCKLPDLELSPFADYDDDGFTADGGDCEPLDPAFHPAAEDACDGYDNDCDDEVDNQVDVTGGDPFWVDADGDGYGDPGKPHTACKLLPGYAANDDDCDDGRGGVHPGAADECNALDDDCDGVKDEDAPGTVWRDADNDGFGDPLQPWCSGANPGGYVSNFVDCDDSRATVNPDATEVCNDRDDDCDTIYDEHPSDGTLACRDGDGDGFGDPGQTDRFCDWIDTGFVTDCTDCNDATNAVGGPVTWYADTDGDDYGDPAQSTAVCGTPASPPHWVLVAGDCAPSDIAVNPGAEEICGTGTDEDCVPDNCRFDATWRLTGTGGGADARFDGDTASDRVGRALHVGFVDTDERMETFVAKDTVLGPGAVVMVEGNAPLTGTHDLGAVTLRTFTDAGEGSTDFGDAVAVLGDIDADGFAELVIGDPRGNDVPAVGFTGMALLYWSGSIVVAPTDGWPQWAAEMRLNGATAGDRFGHRVVATPGARGDALAYAVSAPGVFDDDGAVYLVRLSEHEHEAGISTNQSVADAPFVEKWAGPLDAGAEYGAGLAFFHNEQGEPSLAVGARRAPDLDDGGSVLDGTLYIYRMPTDDVSVVPSPSRIHGYSDSRGGFGSVVVNVGDVDGDATDDLAVSAPDYRYNGDRRGKVYLLSGRIPDGLDVRLEDIPGEYFLGGFIGPEIDGEFGASLAGGDVDRDGYADLLIGAPGVDSVANGAGGAWLIYGGPEPFGVVELGVDPIPAGTRFYGTLGGEAVGASVALGDVTGDGRGDVLIGAPGFDPTIPRLNAGAVFAVEGVSE